MLYLARPTPRSLAIGGAIALVGEMVRIWAAGHLEKGREVTQSGPYRITTTSSLCRVCDRRARRGRGVGAGQRRGAYRQLYGDYDSGGGAP